MNNRLQIAIQKKGRLADRSYELLNRCGVEYENHSDKLHISCSSFPVDLLLLRDDDIPEYVQDGVADLGIVGENTIAERETEEITPVRKLGFGRCRLSIAGPESEAVSSLQAMEGKRIATSYPRLLKRYLAAEGVPAEIIEISGSVEIAPSIKIADYIFDIVSTGNTLRFNRMAEYFSLMQSEAVLIQSSGSQFSQEKEEILGQLLGRIDSVLRAKASKYLMMNAKKEQLPDILRLLPSMKSPTILPLADDAMVSVHAVIPAERRWELMQSLQSAGASGILVLQIDNLVP